jgi:LysR family transcriptional regulator, glycine cleavage system transcriptional activator
MHRSGLPPLGGLRAFEAAARLASFKAAAAELFVTPTAISHQIRQLEEQLGVTVLLRSSRAVSLTAEGKILFDAVASGFADIRGAVTQLRAGTAPAILTLSATTAFFSQWLVPRLPRIQKLLPELDLRLHASDAPVELSPGTIDIAIRYGKGPFPGTDAVALKADAFAPVCSPHLKIHRLADLRQADLIHIDGRTRPRPIPGWRRWCTKASATGIATDAGLRFTDGMLAVQAAIAGQGVVIVSLMLVSDALSSGLLVQPFDVTLPGDTYHFVSALGLWDRSDVATLRQWFQENLK